MFYFGKTSCRRRDECHPDIVMILNEGIKERNLSVLCGKRDEIDQRYAFATKKSKVKWPDSNHNIDPSNPKCEEYPDKSIAVDVAIYHPELPNKIDWKNKDEFWSTAQFLIGIADRLYEEGKISHKLRSGCDWDGDGVRVDEDPDENFFDGPHLELIGV